MVGKSEGKPIFGRPRRGWENNIVTGRIWLETGFALVTGFIGHLQNVTTNNYDSLTELCTPNHCNYRTVFMSRCLVAASNSGRSPSCRYPKCPRPQLPASHFSQLQILTELYWLTAKWLPVFASIAILGSESHWIRDLILHSYGIWSLTGFSH
jgi:hypothetical protein